VVLAPVALGLVWLGGFWLLALLIVVAGIMAWEWERVTFGEVDWVSLQLAILGVAVTAVGLIFPQLWHAVLGGALFAVALVIVAGHLRGRPLAWVALGGLYVVLPCIAIIWLRAEPLTGRTVAFWLLFVVWATDIGAYFAGRTIGGPKLAPAISPNKTWAGLLGGMACAGLVGGLVAQLTALTSVTGLTLASVVLAVVAQAGDLAESAWKRHFGVKDSGSLIPGHGGILDRVDGLLFAALGAAMMALANGGKLLPWQ
jgi:phosphatidate cytidylyltransferase